MELLITGPSEPFSVNVSLPSSKSISNRVLLIRYLSGSAASINNLSNSDDTRILYDILKSSDNVWNAGHSGAASRFLIGVAALTTHEIRIDGSAQLKKRPVGPLVDALNDLGAEISYEGEPGMLPVTVSGSISKGGQVRINPAISSQFVSSLMMIGPKLEHGLEIILGGEVVSEPYIEMTASLMEDFGVIVKWNKEKRSITVPESPYRFKETDIEADWSAASYWYEIAALSPGSKITLEGLRESSIQGDREIISLMKDFGVSSNFESEGLKLDCDPVTPGDKIIRDLSGSPDLGPSMISTAAAKGVTADFEGLQNFRYKESDMASALQRELYQFGVHTDFCGGSKFKVYDTGKFQTPSHVLKTYHDHRIAMSLAPLSLIAGSVRIDDGGVVSKSYPRYWDDLRKAGFRIEES